MKKITNWLGEETLDPNDWESMHSLGHRILDDVMDYLEILRDRPVEEHAPHHVKEHFEGSAPLGPQPPEEVCQEYIRFILPHHLGNSRPRFWGWEAGTGTVMGMYAELPAAATDAISGSFSYLSNNYVEMQVLNWCKSLLGHLSLPAVSSPVGARPQTSSDWLSLVTPRPGSTCGARACEGHCGK